MRILYVHQNFPAQYQHLAKHHQGDPRNEVVAITASTNQRPEIVRTVRYEPPKPVLEKTVPLARSFADHVARGMAVAEAADRLKGEGFTPDVILGHFGWGETLFLKDVWPSARQIVYAEFFYGGEVSDTNFDPEFRSDDLTSRMRTRTLNASLLVSLASADLAIAPTQWQKNRFPGELQAKIAVAHDGIDTERARPHPAARINLGRTGLTLSPGDEVVTFVSRNLEPYRGFHIFMRALPRILRERPNARAIIVGGHGVSYGRAAGPGKSWKDVLLEEVKDRLDLSRVHIVGAVPYETYLQVLQVSAVHVYLTYPFVLSWSLLEAMAAGALIVGSDTPPVREVIQDEGNGLLVDFFDVESLAAKVIDGLARPDAYRLLRQAARRTVVEGFALRRICLPRHIQLVQQIAGG